MSYKHTYNSLMVVVNKSVFDESVMEQVKDMVCTIIEPSFYRLVGYGNRW